MILNNTGLSNQAAEWLVKERSIKGIGIDTISPDSGESAIDNNQPTHRTLLGNGVWIVENVNSGMRDLPARGFNVIALPYKIGGGSGAPTRVIAYSPGWLDEGGNVAKEDDWKYQAMLGAIVALTCVLFLNTVYR